MYTADAPEQQWLSFKRKYCWLDCLEGNLGSRWNLDAEKAIRAMRDYRWSYSVEPDDLEPVALCVRSIPCSSSECERGFSLMNLIHTDIRNSLLVKIVASLMFINTNGPPLRKFDCKPFVKSWKLRHRGASDTQSRRYKIPDDDGHLLPLWEVC